MKKASRHRAEGRRREDIHMDGQDMQDRNLMGRVLRMGGVVLRVIAADTILA